MLIALPQEVHCTAVLAYAAAFLRQEISKQLGRGGSEADVGGWSYLLQAHMCVEDANERMHAPRRRWRTSTGRSWGAAAPCRSTTRTSCRPC